MSAINQEWNAAGQLARSTPVPLPADEVNRSSLLARVTNALAANDAYLALGAPTNAQVAAQVQALTRQVDALIRIAAAQLGAIADA